LGIPDEAARARILSVMCRSMKVEGGLQNFDWASIAKKAVGYVGADLMALTREAAVLAINRIFRSVLPTPVLRPAALAPGASAALPALTLGARTGSPKIDALMPPTAAAPPNPAAAALTASLTAVAVAAAASSSPALVAGSSSPRLGAAAAGNQAHLIPDMKSTLAASELTSRSRASDKLRAHAEPLTESQLAPLCISYGDFHEALKKVQPSSKREGFATIPDVTWNDIGALDSLREELNMTILQPILNPLQFESIGLTVPAGVLLFGPPGCGKVSYCSLQIRAALFIGP
jgi:ribosome biogenesis ATPase